MYYVRPVVRADRSRTPLAAFRRGRL